MSKKINDDITIAIIGMGYVGIPLCTSFLDAGLNVIGLDIDKNRIFELQDGIISLNHLSHIKLEQYLTDQSVIFSTEMEKCREVDAIIICVPTPLDNNMDPDLNPIKQAISSIIPYLKDNQIISLESTTYPGTTYEEIICPIEDSGLKVGTDIYVVYSPEREDPGNKEFNCKNTPKLIGGYSENCLKKGVELYSHVIDTPIPVSSCEIAEFAKLYENIYRAVNIGLANEMKIIADAFDIDIFEIIRAADTKPFGFSAFYPGPGVGGHCIPVDPAYLNWKARSFGTESTLITSSLNINREISEFVVNKTINELQKDNKEMSDANILILGVSYKSNIDDIRESPSINIISHLISLGAKVTFDDNFISLKSMGALHDKVIKVHDSTESKESLKKYDVILLLTNHDYYNTDNVATYGNKVIDTRGIFDISNNIVRG